MIEHLLTPKKISTNIRILIQIIIIKMPNNEEIDISIIQLTINYKDIKSNINLRYKNLKN